LSIILFSEECPYKICFLLLQKTHWLIFFVPEWFEELPCGLPDFFLNSSWVGVYLKSYKVDIHSIVWLKNMWDNYWCWWLQQFTKHNFLNIEFIEKKNVSAYVSELTNNESYSIDCLSDFKDSPFYDLFELKQSFYSLRLLSFFIIIIIINIFIVYRSSYTYYSLLNLISITTSSYIRDKAFHISTFCITFL
jgi:hypothetical protein